MQSSPSNDTSVAGNELLNIMNIIRKLEYTHYRNRIDPQFPSAISNIYRSKRPPCPYSRSLPYRRLTNRFARSRFQRYSNQSSLQLATHSKNQTTFLATLASRVSKRTESPKQDHNRRPKPMDHAFISEPLTLKAACGHGF
jgi:hypothetical protein